jgi:hypothetical protein
MGGARRLAVLASRAASGARARGALAPAGLQVRAFAGPVSNADEYKRFMSAKESAHITVRGGGGAREQPAAALLRRRGGCGDACARVCATVAFALAHAFVRRAVPHATRAAATVQWPEMCNKPLAAVDPEMARNRGAVGCAAGACGA